MPDVSSAAQSAATPQGARPPRPQAVLQVLAKEMISPNLMRVRLGGAGFDVLNRNESTDAYVKLVLPDPASGLTPPYDMEALRERSPELLPVRRTYTVRRWHDAEQALDIDVVVHGEPGHEGVAARWATSAKVGDDVAVTGAGGAYSPRAGYFHVLIGDHAALPAIAAALEAMAADARGVALIHLDEDADRLNLHHPAGVEVRWVIGDRSQLLEATRALQLPPLDGVQAFCHAERGLTKELRRHLVRERGVQRDNLSVSAYWALGRVEDQFQAEKRTPIGKIDD